MVESTEELEYVAMDNNHLKRDTWRVEATLLLERQTLYYQ